MFPLEVVGAPTVREADGLAMSSRNQYLDAEQRQSAAQIHTTLLQMREQTRLGLPLDGVEADATARLQAAGFVVDYAVVRRADLGFPADGSESGLVGLIAARLGSTRLIDNLDFDAA
jgi:pantoate--beta-alanine ligase